MLLTAMGDYRTIEQLGEDYQHIYNSQDIANTLESVGIPNAVEVCGDTMTYGRLMVKVAVDSSGCATDYVEIWGSPWTVPYPDLDMERLY